MRATELLATADEDLEAVTDALVQPRVHRDDDVTVLLARLRPFAARQPIVGAGGAAARSVCLLDIRLDQHPGAVAAARAQLREALQANRVRVAPELLDSMLLVTSELVTNGLRHGEPPVQLTVDHRDSRLRLTVTDFGSNQPRPQVAGPEATGGRGLFLVSALSTAWKIEPHGGDRATAGVGTAVWAEFAL
jgi:anti-sigma regulatory factor (Ser/Thr protein kinase)